MRNRIKMRFSGGAVVAAELKEELAERILRMLPFKSRSNRWGDEIYFSLPQNLDLRGERMVMEIGDVAYWPEGNSLCIFFGPTPVSRHGEPRAISKVAVLGKVVEGLELLRSVRDGESVTVEVED